MEAGLGGSHESSVQATDFQQAAAGVRIAFSAQNNRDMSPLPPSLCMAMVMNEGTFLCLWVPLTNFTPSSAIG